MCPAFLTAVPISCRYLSNEDSLGPTARRVGTVCSKSQEAISRSVAPPVRSRRISPTIISFSGIGVAGPSRSARVGDYRSGRRQDSSVILVVPKSSAVSLVILLDERVPWPNPNKTAALGDGLLNFEERGFYVRPAYDGRINIGPQSKQGPSDTGIVHSFTGGAR